MSSSRDEDRQQALSHHPQQDLVPPASRPSPPGDADAEDNVGSSHVPDLGFGGYGAGTAAKLAIVLAAMQRLENSASRGSKPRPLRDKALIAGEF